MKRRQYFGWLVLFIVWLICLLITLFATRDERRKPVDPDLPPIHKHEIEGFKVG